MYGWRGRIGLLIPANNTVIEPDFYTTAPAGVSVHSTAMNLPGGNEEGFTGQETEIRDRAEVMGDGPIDVLVYGVTAGSLIQGVGYEEEVETIVSDASGLPAIATAASIKRAFRALSLEKVSVFTPYIDELNEREREFLTDSGVDVVEISGLGHDSVETIGELSPATAYQGARTVDCEDADGVFISCTNYHTFSIINALERDIGKPVVSSNQATLWDALRRLGVDTGEIHLGELFTG